MSRITLENIKSFLVGHYNYYKDKLGLLPEHKKEQVLYRLSRCENDCVVTGKCMYCGCPTQKKVFAPTSCNKGKRFPDFMSEEKWYKFKKKKGIDGSF